MYREMIYRIQLIEEGQTKDLTILVGHRLEEGASSQEVTQLRYRYLYLQHLPV